MAQKFPVRALLDRSTRKKGDTMAAALPTAATPQGRAKLETARAKYGCKAAVMVEMFQVGSALADVVISEINELGTVARQQLDKRLVDGLGSLDNPPPAIAAFLAKLGTVPEWADRDTLRAGEVSEPSAPALFKTLATGDRFADCPRLPPPKAAGLIPLLAAASAQSWRLQRGTPENTGTALEQFTAVTVAFAAEMTPRDGTAYENTAA